MTVADRRKAIAFLRSKGVSERRACRLLRLGRSSLRYRPRDDHDEALRQRLRDLARRHPRYGYRRAWAVLRREGWTVNLKRVHRLWKDLKSNVGALNLNLWVHTLIEVWAWNRPVEELSDRIDRPWDDADRQPSHADRHKAVQRAMLEEEYQQIRVPAPWSEKIRHLLESVFRLVA